MCPPRPWVSRGRDGTPTPCVCKVGPRVLLRGFHQMQQPPGARVPCMYVGAGGPFVPGRPGKDQAFQKIVEPWMHGRIASRALGVQSEPQGLSHRVSGAFPGRCFCLMTVTPSENPRILAGAGIEPGDSPTAPQRETGKREEGRECAMLPGGPPGGTCTPHLERDAGALKAGSLSPRASWASQVPGPGQATLRDRRAPLWPCPKAAACGPTRRGS